MAKFWFIFLAARPGRPHNIKGIKEQKVFAGKPQSKTLYTVVNSTAWIPVTVHIFTRLFPFFYPEGFSITPLYRLIWWLSFDLSLLCMLYLMIETFWRYFDKTGRIWSELNRNSYGVYIIHVIVIGVFGTLLLNLNLPALVKYPMLIVLTYKDDEVLVNVHATSVNWHDWHFLTGTPFLARIMAGLLKPKNKVLGIDVAGRVEAVGANVTQFQPGDEVFGSNRHGCFAEYVCVSEEGVVTKPANMTFEEVAAVPGAALTALQALRDHGQIQRGQKVLINGASGGVGTFAVQIAKSLGAEVTGVCSTRNVDLVRAIGADQVIDYTLEDFTQNGERYDLIFDAARKRSFSDCKRVLRPQGIYVTTEFSPVLALGGLWKSMTGNQKMVPLLAKAPNKMDLVFMRELLEGGEVAPTIDRRYSLSELPDALRYLEKGHAQGKVVITI